MDDLRDDLEVEFTAILTGGGSNPTLELTYPVGGEGLSFGKTYNITWESSGLSTVKIEYSGNNGGSWSTLAASVNALLGTWEWTITQAETDLALIKVSSGSLYSQSASVFSVLLETVTIVQPDGGESAVKGSTYDITWTYNDISAVKVELSTDNKVSWSTLSASVAASALKYTWTVTQDRSIGDCFIRLTDAGGSGASDVSAAAFNIIEPTIAITDPDGGETWYAGESNPITWNVQDITGAAVLYYNKSGGLDIKIDDVADVTTGTYSWTIPSDASTEVKVKIVSGAYSDSSAAYFTIATPSITVTDPDGGETWYAGTSQDITWTSLGLTGNFVISYSSNNGGAWTEVATVAYNSSPKAWTIPSVSSAQCLVKIVQGAYSDQSGAVFTIKDPSVTITDPDGGETWYIGESQPVTWDYVDVTGAAVLYYNKSGGDDIKIDDIADVTTGTYSWTIPSDASTEVKVKLVCGSYNDSSAAYFTIATPSITLTEPDGGESLTSGDSFNIEWTSVGITGDVEISYSIDNGASWVAESTVAYDSSPYAWTVPVAISSICLVKIEQGAYSDQSAATFTIIIGAYVVAYVDNSAAPLAWKDKMGQIADGNITLVGVHTLGADSHGSNNADLPPDPDNTVVRVATANCGPLNELGANTAFAFMVKLKGSATQLAMYAPYYNALNKGYYFDVSAGSPFKACVYIGGSIKQASATGGNLAANTWYYLYGCHNPTDDKIYATAYGVTGTLLYTGSVATGGGDYAVPSTNFDIHNYYAGPTISHFVYWNKVPTATEIANAITWCNTI